MRNREVIAEVLARELPKSGTVLEVASGSGEHALYFAERFPDLNWQPSDPDPEALASIEAYRAEAKLDNLLSPMKLDASSPDWPISEADAIFCANMIHISPWVAAEGLFKGAMRTLESGASLILYGPYFEENIEPAPSNLDFEEGLRARNPAWGIRSLTAVDELARSSGFVRSSRYEMPANNLTLVYRRD